MAGDPLISLADLELRVGSQVLARMLDDDGDGNVDQPLVDWCIQVASDEAYGLLRTGFASDDQILAVVDEDYGIKNAVVDLAIGLAASRRPAQVNAQGQSPHSLMRDRAIKLLRDFGTARRRTRGESIAGQNKAAAVRVQPIEAGDTVFIPSTDNPKGPGGF